MLHHSSNKSRQTDIQRILDPSYCRQSPPSPATTTWAYIDQAGEYHDPDFRDFPIIPQRRQPQGRTSPRPHWELHLDENALEYDDDEDMLEDEDDGSLFLSNAPHPQRHHRYSSSSHASRRSPQQYRRTHYVPMYTPTYYSPATTASTLPTSYESDATVFSDSGSPFDEKSSDAKEPRRSLLLGGVKKLRRYSNGRRASLDLPTTTEESEKQERDAQIETVDRREYNHEEEEEDEEEAERRRRTEYVPTCTESLRRQWQTFTLGIRFSVFRARRRLSRRVHSLF